MIAEPENFIAFADYLETSFPAAHGVMQRQRIGDYSLLYHWPGSDPTLDKAVRLWPESSRHVS